MEVLYTVVVILCVLVVHLIYAPSALGSIAISGELLAAMVKLLNNLLDGECTGDRSSLLPFGASPEPTGNITEKMEVFYQVLPSAVSDMKYWPQTLLSSGYVAEQPAKINNCF